MSANVPNFRTIIDQDGAVILNIDSDQFFSMNPVGAFIWSGLSNGESIEQITEALAAATGIDSSRVSADIDEFIAELKSKKLFHFSSR